MGARMSFKVAGNISSAYGHKPVQAPYKPVLGWLDILFVPLLAAAGGLLAYNLAAILKCAIALLS